MVEISATSVCELGYSVIKFIYLYFESISVFLITFHLDFISNSKKESSPSLDSNEGVWVLTTNNFSF